jgi:hypothetical protein
LVVTPTDTSPATAQANPALVNVLAQGQRWLEQLMRGEVASLRSIAQSVGRSERHVSQVIHAAFVAPDLVEAVLQARQPTPLTQRQLMKRLPCDWSEQRRMFVLAPGVPPRIAASEGAAANRRCLAEIFQAATVARSAAQPHGSSNSACSVELAPP